MFIYKKILAAGLLCCGMAGCSKGFLSKPSSTAYNQGNDPGELAGVLNNTHVFGLSPNGGESSADNYYVTDSVFRLLPSVQQRLYTWQRDIYGDAVKTDDWNTPYEQVGASNLVLEKAGSITASGDQLVLLNRDRGRAYFLRAFAFLQLAMQYCPYYDPLHAKEQAGIVLRLHSYDDNLSRSNLWDSYAQTVQDLTTSRELVQAEVPDSTLFIPGKAAVFSLLARVYLLMADYQQGMAYSDSARQLHPRLLDYNRADTGSRYPFENLTDEVIYRAQMTDGSVLSASKQALVDSVLYRSYEDHDLRKWLYFRIPANSSTPTLKSSYAGGSFLFTGTASDEMLLIHAECCARLGKVTECMNDVNTLLVNRYITGTYVPRSASTAEDALRIVLQERRKELVFRGLRWSDLKRLNGAGETNTLVRRINNGNIYLPPNSNLWVLPIPAYALTGTNIVQNPR